MERQILVIEPDKDDQDNLREAFESEYDNVKVFIATTEEEVVHLLKTEKMLKIIMEPLLGIHNLTEKTIIEPSYMGGVGLELFKRFQVLINTSETEIILHTAVCKEQLNHIGFPKDIRYYEKPFCEGIFTEEILN